MLDEELGVAAKLIAIFEDDHSELIAEHNNPLEAARDRLRMADLQGRPSARHRSVRISYRSKLTGRWIWPFGQE